MEERSKVGQEDPSLCTEVKDTKSRMRSMVWVEALRGGQRPSPQSYQERSVQRRGVCIESRCRTQIALQRDMRHPGEGKSESPDQCPSHLGVRVAGRRATPLPAGRRPCMGGAGRGARSNPEAQLPGWQCSGGGGRRPAPGAGREEGRGARSAARARAPADSDGKRVRRLASGGLRRGRIRDGTASSPPAA